MSHKIYNVGTYIRLSQADKRASVHLPLANAPQGAADFFPLHDESVSVENQKAMLSQFISHMPNWIETRTYIDEGVSGGNFDRKGFQDMMKDVRRGIINLVLVKDLSRFGRNYLEAGRYLEEELPALGCRFIALSDNIDTETGDNDIMPFLNAINDFYLRDCSERIKAVIRAKAKDGQKLSGAAPYGYMRKADDRTRLAVDEAAATIVKRIFELRADGVGYTAIAGILTSEGIASPRRHYFERQGKTACANIWSTRTVKLLLNNETYIGNTISLKRGTRSYRDSRTYLRDESEWIRVDNTHIPIIERSLWDKVQKINHAAKERMVNIKPPRPNMFVSLLVCPDCKTKMNRLQKTYYCSTYQRSGKAACSPHRIWESDLKEIVLSQIKGLAKQITLDEGAMLSKLKAKLVQGYKADKINTAKQKQRLAQQIHSMETQIDQLYEDKVAGLISAETFTALVMNLETNRAEAEETLTFLSQAKQEADAKLADIDKWASLIKEKSTSLEVDRDLLEALIEKIEVGEVSETNGQPHQDIQIFYKSVGLC